MKLMLPLLIFASLFSTLTCAKKSLQFKDVFDFKQAQGITLSQDGKLLSLTAKPYRGDPIGQVYDLPTNTLIATVDNGVKPFINKEAQWVVFTQQPTLLETETTAKKQQKTLKNNLVLVNTKSKQTHTFKQVKDYQLSDDGQWLAYREDASKSKATNQPDETKPAIKADKKDTHLPLVLVNLTTQHTQRFENVGLFALSPINAGLVFATHLQDGSQNTINYYNVKTQTTTALFTEPGVTLSQAKWHPNKALVAFNMGNYINDDNRRRHYQVTLWHAEQNTLKTLSNSAEWYTGKTAKLQWSEQGERLYFENRPALFPKKKKLKYTDADSLKEYATIRDQKGLHIWHNHDAHIKPREINRWSKQNKHKHYQAVYHLKADNVVQLSDPKIPQLTLNTQANYLLASDDTPYLQSITHSGFYSDYYARSVNTGAVNAIVKKSPWAPSLSPNGKHAVYFKQQQIWLKDLNTQTRHSLTHAINNAIFAQDKHDYPSAQPGYGFAGWQLDGSVVYVYSKFNIWAFDVATQQATRLTNGRASHTQYRVKHLDKHALGFTQKDTLLLSAHNIQNKQTHIATLNLTNQAVTTVLKDKARFDLVKKAKNSNTLLFTKQHYSLFPDLWQTSDDFKSTAKITQLNPQQADFAWGQAPELVQYQGYDGEDLQGVLIKPANYTQGDKIPVVIYFYRYMSQRMYDFPKMELNHRPNFAMFTSNGYGVFLPDIRFAVGKPGPSSTQTMVNAAQKLIDLGIADANKIGLQGHSWAGYQSAFMITQTDMFKAVVSGAPVSNMTSAYSGIRLKSGLARQFQYETGQSRIGKNLFEAPELYIENSPVFFADKVNTPILIMFGDEDGAVPWQEGIQYYLALRRAKKDAIFLQYKGEPHHLKQFPNQLDFSIRMMEYFDHHLKGKPAPTWITEGEAYQAE